jgi:hypothetical protein
MNDMNPKKDQEIGSKEMKVSSEHSIKVHDCASKC